MSVEIVPQPARQPGELSADVFRNTLPYRYAPQLPSGRLVARDELLRRLTEASIVKRVSIIRGPAGSGKTSLLAQWRDIFRGMDGSVAWLTLEDPDREPTHLIDGLANALTDAGCLALARGFRSVAPSASDTSPIAVAQALASICNRSDEKAVIALDRCEELDGSASATIIGGFLRHVSTARIVLASRAKLEIPIGQLRLMDQIFEIGASELNLTAMEMRSFFDTDVPEIYARRLHLETSGEAVALGFARRALEEYPRDLGGGSWRDHLREFYRDELLGKLPQQLLATISKLMIVERFDLSLAMALIGNEALDVVDRLHHEDGILLYNPATQEYYFSALLRKFLEERLTWLDDEQRVTLHARAATWFEDRRCHLEALRHTISAGDKDRARELLDQIGYATLISREGVPAAHELLDAIDPESLGGSVSTLLSLALVRLHEGNTEEAKAHLERAKQRMHARQDDEPGLGGQFAVTEAYITGFQDQDYFPETIAALETYLLESPGTEKLSRGQAYIALSWQKFRSGDIISAARLVDDAAMEFADTEAVYDHIFMHVHKALGHFWLNMLAEGLSDIELASKMTRIFFAHDHRLQAMTDVIRAAMLFEQGKSDAMLDVHTLVGTVGALESWSEIQIWAHLYGIRVAAAASRWNEARAIINYGIEVAQRLTMPRLDWNMRLASIDVWTRMGESDRARIESNILALPGGAFLGGGMTFLTWREKIAGMLVETRLLILEQQWADARERMQCGYELVATTNARRFLIDLKLCEATILHAQGDPETALATVENAKELSGGIIPIQLFRDSHECLQVYMPDVSAMASRDMPVPATEMRLERKFQDPLTAREREILLFVGEGHQNKVAAHSLGLSEPTVKFHLRNIYRKLQAQNRTEALARYRKLAGH